MNFYFNLLYCGIETVTPIWLTIRSVKLDRIFLPLSGEGGYIYNGKNYPFMENHLYLIPKDIQIQHYYNENNPLKLLYFDFISTPPLAAKKIYDIDLSKKPVIMNYTEYLVTFIEKYEFTGRVPQEYHNILQKQLFTCLFHINEYEYIDTANDKVFYNVIKYIHENYYKDISNEDLADIACLDTSYFIRLFKSRFSKTPHKYVQEHRLTMANYLLLCDVSVLETASSVGFASVTSFIKAYKKYFGYTPAKHKKQY